MRTSVTLFLMPALLCLLVGCGVSAVPHADSPELQNLDRDDWGVVHADELREYLQSRELLDRLRLKQAAVLYYTIQEGWYLPQDNETVEHRRGEGWSIQKSRDP